MTTIIICSVIGFILISAAAMLIVTMPIARAQYTETFVRTSKEKWARECSCVTNEEHVVMYNTGLEWGEKYASELREVEIVSDGLRLVGEFFDFGSQRTALILSGRAEACRYSYYFAEPYRKLGFNILVIDGRAHGESEGKYSGVGVLETGDVSRWIAFLHESCHTEQVVIHGLCVGSSTAIFLAAAHNPYLKAIVLEGPYISFFNVLKQRTRAGHHPTFPVIEEMSWLIRKHTGVNIFRHRPIKAIGKVEIPTLFLCGREDISSLPENSLKLFNACKSEAKELVWFDKGAHSHLRIRNTDLYDETITAFINKCISEGNLS